MHLGEISEEIPLFQWRHAYGTFAFRHARLRHLQSEFCSSFTTLLVLCYLNAYVDIDTVVLIHSKPSRTPRMSHKGESDMDNLLSLAKAIAKGCG